MAGGAFFSTGVWRDTDAFDASGGVATGECGFSAGDDLVTGVAHGNACGGNDADVVDAVESVAAENVIATGRNHAARFAFGGTG